MAPHSSALAWKIPMDGGAWWAAVHGVARSQTRLSDFTFTFHFSLSCIGKGNGNPLQCSCLENPRDGGAWWAAVYGVAQSRTRLKRLCSSSSIFSFQERKSNVSELQQPCPSPGLIGVASSITKWLLRKSNVWHFIINHPGTPLFVTASSFFFIFSPFPLCFSSFFFHFG